MLDRLSVQSSLGWQLVSTQKFDQLSHTIVAHQELEELLDDRIPTICVNPAWVRAPSGSQPGPLGWMPGRGFRPALANLSGDRAAEAEIDDQHDLLIPAWPEIHNGYTFSADVL